MLVGYIFLQLQDASASSNPSNRKEKDEKKGDVGACLHLEIGHTTFSIPFMCYYSKI